MTESMLRKQVDVYSEKFGVCGVIKDYGVVTKLFFSYQGRDIEMGIERDPLSLETFEKMGEEIINSYVSNLTTSKRKTQLYDWYVAEYEDQDGKYRLGYGIVTGHKSLSDSIDMHTSCIQGLYVDDENGELIITTLHNVYHCPLEYCRFEKQDEYPEIVPDYEKVKEKYRNKIVYPAIEPGNILLVLANFSKYYFHSLYYVPKYAENQEPLLFQGYPHIGTFQDSLLIRVVNTRIDLRYFPHFQNIEFYKENTDGTPFYLENIGDMVLYVKCSVGLIKLEPGQRKQVIKENVEFDSPVLPHGDLYPTRIIE